MEKTRNLAKSLDVQIAMTKVRFFGGLLLNLVCIGTVIYVLLIRSEKVYVVKAGGGIWESTSQARTNPETLYIEADDHIRKFYSSFLTFTNLDYKLQIPKAYDLGGNVIKEFNEALRKANFYNDVVTNNYRVSSIVTESKMVGINGDRMKMAVKGFMVLENDFVREERVMDLEFVLVIIPRVPVRNPHGLSIEDIYLCEECNKTIKKERL